MKTQVNIGLEGAFKVDLYSGGRFVESTDWFNNFITATGLYYPNLYAFVDCFRFLSLGANGGTANQGGVLTGAGGAPTGFQQGTTGLSLPINTFLTSQGTTQSGLYIGWQGYANGSDNSQSACGTILTEQGPRFYRAWTIPTGGVNFSMGSGGLVINEFMVSPSSGSDPTGRYAFSRVRRTVTIPVGYSAIISYQLSVNLQNTGLTYFGPNTFTTGSADVSSSPEDLGLVSGWANLSGYYRQVYHGLNIINAAGAHDTPEYGCGMEPSITDLSSYCFYLSPDNSHFDVSKTGNPINSESQAYAADGLMANIFGIPMTYTVSTTSFTDSIFYGPVPGAKQGIGNYDDFPVTTSKNIRIGNDTYFNIPSVSNYASGVGSLYGGANYQNFTDSSKYDISYATPGYLQKNPNKVDYGQKAIFSTRIFKQPMDLTIAQNTISGRTKTITRKTLFSPVSSLGYNTRFGSFVYAFKIDNGTNSIYYPLVDTLFYDSSGRSLMQHYRLLAPVFDNRGTGVADAYITITPSGQNINRYNGRKTFQGPYTVAYSDPSGFDISNTPNPLLSVTSGGSPVGVRLNGTVDPNNTSGNVAFTTDNCSGWGMVYGICADDITYYNQPYDCGLINHNVISGSGGLTVTTAPTKSGTVYWPDKNTNLQLSITGIKYYLDGWPYGGDPLSSGDLVGMGYNWTTNSLGLCPPKAHLENHEHFGVTGYRLLPNFGAPNNTNNNYYTPTMGGSYPGLSFDNGVELYFSISWSSPCSDAVNCL